MKTTRYRVSTRIGMFCIELRRGGFCRVLFGRKELGVFKSAELALGGLFTDARDWPGIARNSSLGLPTDLQEWAPSTKPLEVALAASVFRRSGAQGQTSIRRVTPRITSSLNQKK